MNNNYNNNALTPRQIGMLVVFVVVTSYMLYISAKGMKEEGRKKKAREQSKESKTSNYEIQGADMKKSDNAKWVPLSIILGGIVVTIGAVAMSSRSNKRMKN